MDKSKIFDRTALGNALLSVQYGKISGDARRVLALVDGGVSIAAIFEKVPHSVRIHLNDIFSQLLSDGLIKEIVKAVDDLAEVHRSVVQDQQVVLSAKQSEEGKRMARAVEKESKRRIELEHELEEVQSQLEATKTRQQAVEAVCRKLKQQIAAFERSKHENNDEPPPSSQADTEIELHDSLNDFSLLNQALIDQKNNLDSTLKLQNYQTQLKAEQDQKETEVVDEKLALSNPHYKKLRNLEFFKGFVNAELLHFIGFAKWQKVRASEIIFNEGELSLPFYIIVSGSVNIIRESQVLASLGWGEFFGELAYLSEVAALRSAQAVAITDCELLVVEPMDIELSSVQMRLNVVEALLRGQVERAKISSQRIDSLMSQVNTKPNNE